jgi:hypothetical protein
LNQAKVRLKKIGISKMPSEDSSRTILKKIFPATGADGQSYEIHVYVKSAPSDTTHGAPIEKIESIVLADGTPIRVIAKGKYEIGDSGVAISSSHRDAI